MASRVFFITGTSTGFGHELVKVVLAKGDIAIATARDPSKLSFPGTNAKNYLALPLDVTDEKSIHSAIEKTVSTFNRIDVLINNAGYGLCGPFESLSETQIRRQMEVNFFGLIAVSRAGMEVMRNQKPPGGVIQQVTSIGGLIGMPTFSVYGASKFAVEGWTEAVSKEVKPEWGIKFTCVEPGGFRTDWAGRSMDFGEKENAYDHINAKERMGKRHGTQVGDPPKAASAMHQLAVMKDPPLRCILGSDAYKLFSDKIEENKKNVERFERLTKSTDVDE